MLQYLTPSTLKAIYEDLEEARIELVEKADNQVILEQYKKLTDLVMKIDTEYENITGECLWIESAA